MSLIHLWVFIIHVSHLCCGSLVGSSIVKWTYKLSYSKPLAETGKSRSATGEVSDTGDECFADINGSHHRATLTDFTVHKVPQNPGRRLKEKRQM